MILDQGYGYGFALGLGAAFAVIMIFISKLLSKYMGEVQNSEGFSTASRSVRSGLIASSTVSAWTWPATLLTAGAWGYSHGVSGPFLYAIAGCIQVTLFVFLALELKRNAPGCHTVAQLMSVRFGKAGHICYLCYCIATNVLISSLLLLGGGQGFAGTTGMHVVAALFLLPCGVCAYTMFGGLKATFISDWIHTVIIYVTICVACFKAYASSDAIGSPGKMWDLLQEVQKHFPSATGENYLNFKDKDMILLTWSVMLGGLSSVFGDPGYSQRAIASRPKSVFAGYTLGSACWLVVPWALGSSAGLSCRALLLSPRSITYPRELTLDEVNSGMPVIYGLAALLGKSGAAAGLMILFMSVTSATSAELIAFSSISTYDIYQTYFRPNSTGKELVRVAHMSVVCFSVLMASLAVVFNYVGVTVSWLMSFIGIILGPEVMTLALAMYWKKMSKYSVIIGAPMGTLTGIACWLGSTYSYGGKLINKDTLMTPEATFIGNITSLISTPVYLIIITLIKPENFDFSTFLISFKAADDSNKRDLEGMHISERERMTLKRQSFLALFINAFLLLGVYIILPVSYYGTNYTFSKKYFTQWIVIMLIWLLFAVSYITLFPIWQGRHSIKQIVLSIWSKDARESSTIDIDSIERRDSQGNEKDLVEESIRMVAEE